METNNTNNTNNTKKNKKNNNNKNNKNTKSPFNDSNIGDMMREVNEMLQKNPEMIKKVSKCVNNIFENESLMNKLVSEINTGIVTDSVLSGSDSDSGSGDEAELDSQPVPESKLQKKTKSISTEPSGPIANLD